MSDLQVQTAALEPTSLETLEKLAGLHEVLRQIDDVEIATEHLIHGGMYTRTLRLPPGVVSLGSLIKLPTVLILNGPAAVLMGETWKEFEGYNVLPGRACRKQLVVTYGYVEMSMIFPTFARTVVEAEDEIFAEAHLLLSRRDPSRDTITITGE